MLSRRLPYLADDPISNWSRAHTPPRRLQRQRNDEQARYGNWLISRRWSKQSLVCELTAPSYFQGGCQQIALLSSAPLTGPNHLPLPAFALFYRQRGQEFTGHCAAAPRYVPALVDIGKMPHRAGIYGNTDFAQARQCDE